MNVESGAPLLTSDVADILDVSTDMVRYLERNGQLHAVKSVGGVRIFDREDVERYARQRAAQFETRRSARR
jgi:excisionase family DNA binding protein